MVLSSKPNNIANLQAASLPEGKIGNLMIYLESVHMLRSFHRHRHSNLIYKKRLIPIPISYSQSSFLVPIQPAVVIHGPHEIPRTTSSTYGWDTVPLMRVTDRRFYHPKQVTEITKMYGTALKKESKSEKA